MERHTVARARAKRAVRVGAGRARWKHAASAGALALTFAVAAPALAQQLPAHTYSLRDASPYPDSRPSLEQHPETPDIDQLGSESIAEEATPLEAPEDAGDVPDDEPVMPGAPDAEKFAEPSAPLIGELPLPGAASPIVDTVDGPTPTSAPTAPPSAAPPVSVPDAPEGEAAHTPTPVPSDSDTAPTTEEPIDPGPDAQSPDAVPGEDSGADTGQATPGGTATPAPTGTPATDSEGGAGESPANEPAPSPTAMPIPPSTPALRASASSSRSGAEPSGLVDGDLSRFALGDEWVAGDGDTDPSVKLTFSTSRRLSSVQIFGPSQTYYDPWASAYAAMNGQLVFDDGTRIVVSGIASGNELPTTIAFPARETKSITLELHRSIRGVTPSLREFVVFDAGTTPPQWPATGASAPSVRSPNASACDETTRALGSTDDGNLALVCPTPGSAVDGASTIVVAGRSGASVTASGWDVVSNTQVVLSSGSVANSGRATLSVDTSRLARGPISIKVEYSAPRRSDTPLYVQLVNVGGAAVSSGGFAPGGMTLQWSDDFRGSLSTTQTGAGAQYAATKPAYWGISEFGDAYFSDPQSGAQNIANVDGEYLRLRLTDTTRTSDPAGWNRKYDGGIVSSMRVGGSGFMAQYGYYEARILGAPGEGTWPAFWMLSSEGSARSGNSSGEVDMIELYGHNTDMACRSIVSWTGGAHHDLSIDCSDIPWYTDWAMTWHTYGVQIRPGGADYYIDGRLVSSHQPLSNDDEPFFFMLNLAAGGGYTTDLSRTGGIADMYVDWVRVYS